METMQILEQMKQSDNNVDSFVKHFDSRNYPQDKMTMEREKHLIFFFNPKIPQKKIRYNLKKKRMERYIEKEKIWAPAFHEYEFFRGHAVYNINCPEEKFEKLLRKVIDLNPNCSSLSTFVTRFNDALVYENFIDNGVLTECRAQTRWNHKRVLTKPAEFYSKPILNFLRNNEIILTCHLESAFTNYYSILEKAVLIIDKLDVPKKEKSDIFLAIADSYRFNSLIQTHKYDMDALIKYVASYLVPFENYSYCDAFSDLEDYFTMANAIGRNIKKYPKYLKSMHDIISSNYKAYKTAYPEDLFMKRARFDLEIEEKEYSIVIPKNSKDIVNEGACLNHCVGSYVQRIIDGYTYIFFLRKTENKEDPLITLELRNNQILQAKGSYNRPMTKEELEFMTKYCKKLNIELNL